MMVVGNKCDLEDGRVISAEQGQSFADEHGCKFMEISASDDVNVIEVSLSKNRLIYAICYMRIYKAKEVAYMPLAYT